MTDDQRDILRMALEQMEAKAGLVWGPEWMEEVAAALRALLDENAELAQRTAERDALAAEVAALKANDPLAEMWRELSEYQPFADRDGHGESWRRMCEERTQEAAWAARYVATMARTARDAAAFAEWVMSDKNAARASRAIDAIRRAKEAR
jgi:hypothetical protein